MNIDGLNIYYAEFIKNKYIKKLNPLNKLYKLNLIWAKSILITSYLYSNKIKNLISVGYDLFKKYDPAHEKLANYIIDGKKNYYPYARFHYSWILYAYFSQNKKINITNTIQLVSDDINKILNCAEQSVVLAQIFEALTVVNKQKIIISFSENVKNIIKNIEDATDTKKNESESLIQMCYYYNKANYIQDRIDVSDKLVMPELFDNKNYINSYACHFNALKSLMFDSPQLKNEYINKALNYACKMNNKFLIKQIAKKYII